MTRRKRVLFVCHNHPQIFPGGAEIFAYELFSAMRETGTWEPFFLARTGPGKSRPKTGTPFLPIANDPNQILAYTDQFDYFYGVQPDKTFALVHFKELLETYRPDIVHFQHTIHLGYELIAVVKNVLPDVAIVYTLHEYLPICFSNGQMVRPGTMELCEGSSPERCHECFPERSPQQFFLRERLIKAYLQNVDMFISPSRFLIERYRDWGLPADRLKYVENGRTIQRPAPARTLGANQRRTKFGFFGQFNPYKGVDLLLEALAILRDEGHSHVSLTLHGSNLELQSSEFQGRIRQLLDDVDDLVTMHGSYVPEDLPVLMHDIDWVVVPSVWWENAPLVIQEAFMHRRPVICSDIGGMAEKVEHGVSGLHFRAQEARSLAEALLRASSNDRQWERLRDGIPAVPSREDAIRQHLAIYEELLQARTSATEGDRVEGTEHESSIRRSVTV